MTKFNIIKLDATTSTNDWLKEKYIKSKCFDGDLVWANEQTNGKGQKGNVWISEPGKNLTFSFFKILKGIKVQDQFLINCAVSLAIIKALEKTQVPKLSLKWPNDILSDEKKICGILIENFVKGDTLSGSIVGVGLNVNQIDFGELISASSIFNQTDKELDLELVLNRLLVCFEENFKFCKSKHKNYLIKEYENHLFGKNQVLKFEIDNKIFGAVIKGIDSQGKLILEDEKGEINLFSRSSIKMLY